MSKIEKDLKLLPDKKVSETDNVQSIWTPG
jgi:hypothetical protein